MAARKRPRRKKVGVFSLIEQKRPRLRSFDTKIAGLSDAQKRQRCRDAMKLLSDEVEQHQPADSWDIIEVELDVVNGAVAVYPAFRSREPTTLRVIVGITDMDMIAAFYEYDLDDEEGFEAEADWWTRFYVKSMRSAFNRIQRWKRARVPIAFYSHDAGPIEL